MKIKKSEDKKKIEEEEENMRKEDKAEQEIIQEFIVPMNKEESSEVSGIPHEINDQPVRKFKKKKNDEKEKIYYFKLR